ncbi:MAG: hypothetical protein Q9P14_06500 [candidate division KSB1 bacterium]|nr:hypothetical protein [candidate division KSB1 bacterium]
MPKYSFRIFFVSLIIGFAFCADVLAQLQYEIIAVKGKVGIIRTPLDRPLQVGEIFTVVRYRSGQRIKVARVKIALVEKKFTGIKIIEPLKDTRLRKGDLLEVEAVSLEERLQELENHATEPEDEQLALKGVPPTGSSPHATPEPEEPVQSQPAEMHDQPAAQSRTDMSDRFIYSGPLHVVRQNRPFVGPLVAVFAPINSLADEMDFSGLAGVQVTALLRNQMHLRFGLEYAPLRLSPELQDRLHQLGISQTSYFIMLTASLQQYFTRRFFWNVGGGIYRLTDIQNIGGEQLQVSNNYFGLHAGAGFNVISASSSKLIFATNGHMYFPVNSYRMFLSILLSWVYAL